MFTALALALRQLTDPVIVRILMKCVLITLALFVVIGVAGWFAIDGLLSWLGVDESLIAAPEGVRGLLALTLILIGGWLAWRILALAVLQFYADEVVVAVEARHYPDALANARPLGWQREMAVGLRGAGRAITFNLLALPVALVLIVTGIGPALVFLFVNGVLLGRELTEMVWLRHAHELHAPLPLSGFERLVLGGLVVLGLSVPFANLLAPILGAAAATHLVHRSGAIAHAP